MNTTAAAVERGSTAGTARTPGIAWDSVAIWAVLSALGILVGVLAGASVIQTGGVGALLAGLFLTAGAVAGAPILARGVVVRRQNARSARITRRDAARSAGGSARGRIDDRKRRGRSGVDARSGQ